MRLITSEFTNDRRTIKTQKNGHGSYPGSVLRPNEVVYFVVTNVEYDVLGKDLSSQPEDMYLGSTLGELGYWVDTAATRVVQTGLEHMRIPDIGGYLDWGTVASQTTKHSPTSYRSNQP